MKLTSPTASGAGYATTRRRVRPLPYEPKAIWGYINLMCGHITTPEESYKYRQYRAGKNREWCGECQGWTSRKPRPKTILPDQPLF